MNNQDGINRSRVESPQQREVAVLAGGCFWGVEEILRDVPRVIDTEVGYTGGWLENPTYADTHHSKSGTLKQSA
jgi:peptide methionine sulfoxide reductase MsrA